MAKRFNTSSLTLFSVAILLACTVCAPVLCAETQPNNEDLKPEPITIKIVFRPPANEDDLSQHYLRQNEYRYKLLELAISKIDTPIQFEYVSTPRMEYIRMREFIYSGKLDIFWLHRDETLNDKLVPIRFPMYRGLMGLRVSLITKKNKTRFNNITTIDDLHTLYAGQGKTWVDSKILRHNHINLITSDTYDGVFRMLKMGRFDYLPRAVVEIEQELLSFSHDKLMIEPSFSFQYPAAFYFYMHPSHENTAKLIEQGLYRAVEDGSFHALFDEYHSKMISQLNLNERIIFPLTNPFLPELTPKEQAVLWRASP